MKKTMFWCALLGAALFGSACKKEPEEKAGEQVRKSVEEVREQGEDVREAEKDVTEQQRELQQAQGELTQARESYVQASRARLAKLQARIAELEARTDAKSKDAAIALRSQHDAIAAELDTAGTRPVAEWDKFRENLDEKFKSVEREADDALEGQAQGQGQMQDQDQPQGQVPQR